MGSPGCENLKAREKGEGFLEPPRPDWVPPKLGVTSYLVLTFGCIGCMVLSDGELVFYLLCQNKTEKMKGERGGDRVKKKWRSEREGWPCQAHSGWGCDCMKASEVHQWKGPASGKLPLFFLGIGTICSISSAAQMDRSQKKRQKLYLQWTRLYSGAHSQGHTLSCRTLNCLPDKKDGCNPL